MTRSAVIRRPTACGGSTTDIPFSPDEHRQLSSLSTRQTAQEQHGLGQLRYAHRGRAAKASAARERRRLQRRPPNSLEHPHTCLSRAENGCRDSSKQRATRELMLYGPC